MDVTGYSAEQIRACCTKLESLQLIGTELAADEYALTRRGAETVERESIYLRELLPEEFRDPRETMRESR